MRYSLFFIFVLFNLNLSSQTFNKRFQLSSPNLLFSSVVVSDSTYYVYGTRIDSIAPYYPQDILVKIDEGGNLVDLYSYKDSLAQRFGSVPALEIFDDKLYYGGLKFLEEGRRIFISQINKQGNKNWEEEFVSYYIEWDQTFIVCLDIEIDAEGNCYLLNNATSTSGNSNIVIIKTDSIGNMIWQRATGASNRDDLAGNIINAEDGNLYVATTQRSLDVSYSLFPYQTRIFKIDTTGNVIWDYISPSEQGQIGHVQGIVEAEDGGLVVNALYGYEHQEGNPRYMEWEKYIFKISSSGELIWELEVPSSWLSPGTGAGRIIKTSDGSGYVSVGNDLTYDGGEDSISRKGWIGKVDDNGNLLWSRTMTGVNSLQNFHNLYDVKETPDGGFVAVGYSEDETADTLKKQAWIIKTDEYGCLVPGCNLTSVDNLDKLQLQFSIYPNPVSDILNIWYADEHFSINRPPQFTVSDAQGRIVKRFSSYSNNTTLMLPVDDLLAGTYYLYCSEREGVLPFLVLR